MGTIARTWQGGGSQRTNGLIVHNTEYMHVQYYTTDLPSAHRQPGFCVALNDLLKYFCLRQTTHRIWASHASHACGQSLKIITQNARAESLTGA